MPPAGLACAGASLGAPAVLEEEVEEDSVGPASCAGALLSCAGALASPAPLEALAPLAGV